MSEQVTDTETTIPEAPQPDSKSADIKGTVKDPVSGGTSETARQPVNYTESGNKSLDAALKILGRSGIASDSFEMKAARQGNFEPLKAVLQYTGAEDGDVAVQLMEAAYNDHTSKVEAERVQLREDLLKIAGGEKDWDATLSFIDKNATPEEADELMKALESGGAAARMAARYMATLYQTHGKAEGVGTEATKEASQESPRATGTRSGAGESGYISSEQFYQQYQTLLNQGAREDDPRVIRLQQARLRSIKTDGY